MRAWGMATIPFDQHPDYTTISEICTRIRLAETKGDLWKLLAGEVMQFSLLDLQRIGGKLRNETLRLPHSYGKKARPYLEEQLFGKYHELLLGYLNQKYLAWCMPISDRDRFDAYFLMVPRGSFCWDDGRERFSHGREAIYALFYYLICGFAMFVLDEPGHPVGTPFPGGYIVEERRGEYYCPIRDKEEDVFFSICNFCPALQLENV
jgi:hypothetical protein